MTINPQFVVDQKGSKRGVLLSLKEYQELLEIAQDVLDASLIDEVKSEKSVAWRKAKAKFKK